MAYTQGLYHRDWLEQRCDEIAQKETTAMMLKVSICQ
jgi:hypothetical protein